MTNISKNNCFNHCLGRLLPQFPKKDILVQLPKATELNMQDHGIDIVQINHSNEDKVQNILCNIVNNLVKKNKINLKNDDLLKIYTAPIARIYNKSSSNNTSRQITLTDYISWEDKKTLNEYLNNIVNDDNFTSKYKSSFKPSIQIGSVSTSLFQHKDNGSSNGKDFDFSFVYPLMTLSKDKQKSPTLGTFVLPNNVKQQLGREDLYKKSKKDYRGTACPDYNIPHEYFLNIPEGFGGIWRNATQTGHENDGESVIHFTPPSENPNEVRVIIHGRYNKRESLPLNDPLL